MELFIYQLRMAYKSDPAGTIFLLVLSIAAGFGFGLRILGPTLLGWAAWLAAVVLLGSVSAGFDAAGLDEEREPQYHEQVGEQKEKGFFDWQISDGPARVVASAMVQIPWPIAVESASHK